MLDIELKRLSPALAGLIAIASFAGSLAGSLAACRSSEPPPTDTVVVASPTPAPLVPAIRLVGTNYLTGGGPAIERGAHVSIGGVIRPTFSGSTPFLFRPSCTPVEENEGLMDCTVPQPEKLTAPWAMVEALIAAPRAGSAEGSHEAAPPATRTIRVLVTGPGHPETKTETLRLPGTESPLLTRRLIHHLPQRGVLTPEITLPGKATFRTWIGIEPVMWSHKTPAVVFTVNLIRPKGTEPQELFRTTLDPTQNPDHRRWVPVEFELPDLGEEPFHLVFETMPADKDDQRPTLPVWADPTILRPEGERLRPRLVVLVSLDTLRAKSMSIYGNDRPTTPLFEKMLDEGTLFENAFTTFSNTLGSHMSMMTGLYPATHRVRSSNRNLDGSVPTLAMGMRDAGYETAAFTENALLSAQAGFQRGFARYYENKTISDGAGDAEGTFRRALDWVESRETDEPVFLFVHTYEVHHPYAPPSDTADALGELVWEEATGPTALKRRDLYEHEIVHLDRLLADFLTELKTLAPPEDLLVVITADHGEEFMEHGSVLHLQLYDEVMQVPMFMRWPGRVPGGVRVDTPVSLVDLVPTMLELVGGNVPENDGTSLVPLLDGAEIARETIFGQTAISRHTNNRTTFVVRSKDAKCLMRDTKDGGSHVECYDLESDPLERSPQAPGDAPRFTRLHEELIQYQDIANRKVAGEAEEKELEAGDEIDPVRREKLRQLGYIE